MSQSLTTTVPQDHNHNHSHSHSHIGPREYLIVFAALLGLMALTIVAACFDLGAANFPVAMGIATLKMALVILYFMHVRSSDKLTWVFSIAAFPWLLILIIGCLNDYFTRGLVGGK